MKNKIYTIFITLFFVCLFCLFNSCTKKGGCTDNAPFRLSINSPGANALVNLDSIKIDTLKTIHTIVLADTTVYDTVTVYDTIKINNASVLIKAAAYSCCGFKQVQANITDSADQVVFFYTPNVYDYEIPENLGNGQPAKCNIICNWKPSSKGKFSLNFYIEKACENASISKMSITVK